MKNWHYALLVFLGGCCYGILSTFVKLAYSVGFSPSEVTGSQYFLGTILIWSAVLFTKKKKLNLKQILKIMMCGIPFGLTGIFYYHSLKTLNASLAIIFLFQFVWIGALFDWIFNKKKPGKQKLVSIIILLIGSFLAANIFVQKNYTFSLEGTIFGILAALSYTTFIFFSSSVEKDTPPVLKSALLSTSALVVIFLLFPPSFLFHFHILRGLIPYGLILGIFGVVFPPILFSIGMPKVEPSLGTILPASELPVATIMSSIVLSEYVNPSQWFGVILILIGIIVGNVVYERKAVEA
ncbi:EamA family transporter [Clostridium felsineum]|uniref:Uncharacterized protein n=1 Tax=Clostridium felsineum TaxID=36839 RepID=A0A1S8L1N4_9CLOT|nr:DMT family transporter [Clostridium felsineum]MCR3758619.1 DMT family transporter [Clostridium felsineum]URZ09211.1 hypothetical protein CLROS_046270 [Clostridium felsineum]URZ13897.1 hypothetical protein CROST_046750 [Clostridium felsineum]